MTSDIVFSTIFIFIDLFLWKYNEYLKREIAENEADDDPEVEKYVKNLKIVTILAPVFMAIIALPVITWGIIPLLELLFGSLVTSVTNFLRTYGVYILLAGIGIYLIKDNKPKKPDEKEPIPLEVAVVLARQRAKELYPTVLAFMFRVMMAVSQNNVIKRVGDPHDIETSAVTGEHFYMTGEVAVYQFECKVDGEVTQAQADAIRDDLQKYGANYIRDYPMIISPEAGGRTPFEVLTVHALGNRVCIDVVLTTKASIKLIDTSRRARAERQVREEQERPIPYVDPDYGE